MRQTSRRDRPRDRSMRKALMSPAAIKHEAMALLKKDTSPLEPPSSPSRFQVTDEGVLYVTGDADPVKLSARIDVVAETRDDQSENWGRCLEWRDAEGTKHQWAMPLELLASESAAVRARLLSGGLTFITSNARLRERFTEYLQTTPAPKRVRCVSRIGWHGSVFVFPDGAVGSADGEEILYQPGGE